METDFFENCACAPANRTLEIEIASASRVGLDGVSVAEVAVNAAGELVIEMSDGRTVNAGRVMGASGLKGIAQFDTQPTVSPDPQLYIAVERGVYGYFLNRWGAPLQVGMDQSIALFFCPAGETAWDVSEMRIDIDLAEYKKRGEWMIFSGEAPVFSCYPPSADAVPGLYDPATGRFNLPEGATTVTSQTEVFGRIVYTDCTHIMVGFNLSYTMYLEVATGRCLLMDVFTRATHYHNEPFATSGITKKYVRVNTYNADSTIIDIEESDDGIQYTPYITVSRGAWPSQFITYRTIGFYQPGTNESKILSIGRSDRMMLDQVPVLENPSTGVFEVLSPSDNFVGAVRRTIATGGRSFAGKRIVLYGDSITNEFGVAPDTYVNMIRKKFGTQDVIRLGHDGHTLGSLTTDRSQSLTNDQLINEVTAAQPDLVILQGGVGDYWSNVPLGNYSGNIENPNYVKNTIGGLRYLLHHLTKNLPVHCRLLFVTPPPGTYGGVIDTTPNNYGLQMADYVYNYREISPEYHVPVCNFWAIGGWSTYNENLNPYYTTDGVHLSPQGYDRMTDLIVAEVSRCC